MAIIPLAKSQSVSANEAKHFLSNFTFSSFHIFFSVPFIEMVSSWFLRTGLCIHCFVKCEKCVCATFFLSMKWRHLIFCYLMQLNIGSCRCSKSRHSQGKPESCCVPTLISNEITTRSCNSTSLCFQLTHKHKIKSRVPKNIEK